MTAPAPAPSATAATPRLLVEGALTLAVLGLLLWGTRSVLSPYLLLPLVLFLLWPARVHPMGRRAILAAIAVFLAWFLAEMASVLTPFAVAFGVAYLLAPAVAMLERRRVPRAAAIALVLIPFLALLVLLLLLLIPTIERQLADLASRIPELARRVFGWGMALRERILASGGAGLLTDAQLDRLQRLQPSDLAALVSDQWGRIGEAAWKAALGVGRGIGSGLNVLLSVVGYVVVAPVVAFYLLKSWGTITAQVEATVPPAWRGGVFGFLREYDQALGRYVRGQLTEAALVGVLTGGALALLGFPGAILIGVVAGIFNLIPVIGLPISIIPGIVFALVAPHVGTALLQLVGVFAVVQFIDGSITGPRIVGSSVGLNPVWVMIAVLVFGALLGFVGMLLAVPLAVLVKMLAARAWTAYQRSDAYTAPEAI